LKPYFSEEQLAQIEQQRETIDRRASALLLAYTYHPFKNKKAREYASNGFSRRVTTLSRCIYNVFETVPPSETEVPSRDRLYDIQINLQSFVANVYGSIDNLAWIWIFEKGLGGSIPRKRVGLRKQNTEVRVSLNAALRAYLETLDPWMDYLVDFRDALAHRIPLYVPPGSIPRGSVAAYNHLTRRMNDALIRLDPTTSDHWSAEQARLLVFQPMMTHSISEARGLVPFHAQMLADFATVEELGTKMVKDLEQL
jgi:hypothetical protein